MARKLIIAIAATLAVMTPAATGHAGTGYDLNDFTYAPGDPVDLSVVFPPESLMGWDPNGPVQVTIESAAVGLRQADVAPIDELEADADGDIEGEVVIPEDQALGIFQMVLRGLDADGAERSEAVELVILVGALPTTGSSNLGMMMGIAALAFGVGFSLFVASRRREAELIE